MQEETDVSSDQSLYCGKNSIGGDIRFGLA